MALHDKSGTLLGHPPEPHTEIRHLKYRFNLVAEPDGLYSLRFTLPDGTMHSYVSPRHNAVRLQNALDQYLKATQPEGR